MGPGSRGGGLNGDGSIQRHPWLKMSIEFEALDHVGLNEGIQRDKAFISFSINKAMVKLSRSCLLAELSLHEAMFKGRQKESGRTTLLEALATPVGSIRARTIAMMSCGLKQNRNHRRMRVAENITPSLSFTSAASACDCLVFECPNSGLAQGLRPRCHWRAADSTAIYNSSSTSRMSYSVGIAAW